jgi:hypothetical protein
MHLHHVHTKMNIPSLSYENQRPRQKQHHDTLVSLLIERTAVILVKQHGQIQCTMDSYFSGKTIKRPFT